MSAAYLRQLGELSRRYGVAAGNRIHKLVCASASWRVPALCAERLLSGKGHHGSASCSPLLIQMPARTFMVRTATLYPAEYRLVFRRVCCAEPTAQRRLVSVCAGINACHCCNDIDGPTPTTHEKASLQSTNWSRAAKPHATVYCLPVEEVRVRGRVRRRDPGLLRLLQDFCNASLCVARSASCCVSEFTAGGQPIAGP